MVDSLLNYEAIKYYGNEAHEVQCRSTVAQCSNRFFSSSQAAHNAVLSSLSLSSAGPLFMQALAVP